MDNNENIAGNVPDSKNEFGPSAGERVEPNASNDGAEDPIEVGDAPGVAPSDIPPPDEPPTNLPILRMSVDEFYAHLPSHDYLHIPTLKHWPRSAVNTVIPAQPAVDEDGDPIFNADGTPSVLTASYYLDCYRPIMDKTWSPGDDELIKDRVIQDGGWFDHPGMRTYNMYRPPVLGEGDPNDVDLYLEHCVYLYPDTWEYILDWGAQRVQRPGEKVNHALCLFGPMRIGKDLIVDTFTYAVGRHNARQVSPSVIMGQFNEFMQSVLLIIPEVKEDEKIDRYQFYNCTKTIIAAPPFGVRCNPKHITPYTIPNVTGVVIMSNYKIGGLYLPPDDGRHHVSCSSRKYQEGRLTDEYFVKLWGWLHNQNGYNNVAAFLKARDISKFNAKVPPPKTQAFWDVVGVAHTPEDGELADALDELGKPPAVTLLEIRTIVGAGGNLWDMLRDPKHARKVPHKMAEAGYVPVRHPTAYKGLWTLNGVRQVIYVKDTLSAAEQIAAAEALVKAPPKPKWEQPAKADDNVADLNARRKAKGGSS
jgi:hypothetical protein